MLDIAGRIFRKSISLLEQRLHIKISNAVMIIDTDNGEHFFQLKENDFENLSLMSRHFHEKLIELAGKKQFISGIVPCTRCLGTGRASMDTYENCPVCKGGGQLARIYPINTAQNEPQNYDETNTEPLQIPE